MLKLRLPGNPHLALQLVLLLCVLISQFKQFLLLVPFQFFHIEPRITGNLYHGIV